MKAAKRRKTNRKATWRDVQQIVFGRHSLENVLLLNLFIFTFIRRSLPHFTTLTTTLQPNTRTHTHTAEFWSDKSAGKWMSANVFASRENQSWFRQSLCIWLPTGTCKLFSLFFLFYKARLPSALHPFCRHSHDAFQKTIWSPPVMPSFFVDKNQPISISKNGNPEC